MFELTNRQRKCFGLPAVTDLWERIEVSQRPYDAFSTFAYLDGNRVKKVVLVCESDSDSAQYREIQVDVLLSDDRKTILPKTEKGKPKPLSSSNLLKCSAVGMSLNYAAGNVIVANETSRQSYYESYYDDLNLNGFSSFEKWVEDWCADTGDEELRDIGKFSAAERVHQKYREGDFFRFRINRILYGYGRILIDFGKMRKAKVPFWDIFMGKPLCVAVYHIATERDDVTPEELVGLRTLPSQMIMDNKFFYGEYAIIGNMPVPQDYRDYPIHYGHTISVLETGVRYQCGKTFISLYDEQELYGQYRNGGIGWNLNVKLPILQKCINAHSNQPYWELSSPYRTDQDLRNPKLYERLQEIRRQVGIDT